MTKDEALQMCLEYIETDAHERKYVRHAIKQALAAQRQWVGLTDEERNKLWRDVVKWGDPSHDDVDLIKAIEAKLKEKNHDPM